MWFSKRNAKVAVQTAGAQVSQQQAPRQRILPAELWESDVGGFLRDIGMSPDDESNLVQTADSIDARVAQGRAKLEAKLAEINRNVARQTAGGSVRPYYLFGEPSWNSEVGTFLMARLGYFPFDDWNVLFLPEDERTAKAMDLPVHPGGPIPGSDNIIEQWYQEAKGKLDAAHAEAGRTHQFAKITATQQEIKRDVWGLASALADHIGARAAWKPQG
jgi:hypothetical protein